MCIRDRACNVLKRRLLIVGTGREEQRLKALAGSTIEFLGFVPDADLPPLYAHCRAFLFAADEDFGIVPVESQSYGRPVIAYGYGGSLETVRAGDPGGRPDTGVFFAQQTVESVVEAIRRFEAIESSFIPAEIQRHARQFDTDVYKRQLDYIAGAKRLAPRWMGTLGLEWAFRLATEPRRLAHRYLVEPWGLVGAVIANALRSSKHRWSPAPPDRIRCV